MRISVILVAVALIFGACSKSGCDIKSEIKDQNITVKIDRLEKPFFKFQSKDQIVQFLDKYPLFAEKYLQRSKYPHDSILVNSLYKLATSKDIDKLADATDKTFGDAANLEQDLELAFKHIKYYYPEFTVPEVKTFISGFANDIAVADSLLVISLENFIGPQAPFRPDFPQYILRRYQPEYIVPTAVLALSDPYNKTDFLNKTLLAEMIYYGKAYYFATQMLPCTPDSLILGYSNQNIADVFVNQDKIWAHFIEHQLLYETSHFKVNKYISERPNVPEIGAKCPGRIGRWVGLQIVRAYMENNADVTLQQLMAEKDPQK
ncbi:MAG: gliding motility lipoprotein GldB, partial [Chitinophagaceae bacterium]